MNCFFLFSSLLPFFSFFFAFFSSYYCIVYKFLVNHVPQRRCMRLPNHLTLVFGVFLSFVFFSHTHTLTLTLSLVPFRFFSLGFFLNQLFFLFFLSASFSSSPAHFITTTTTTITIIIIYNAFRFVRLIL